MAYTNWENIRRKAGPHPDFPGFDTYLFGSLSRAVPTEE